MNSLVVLFSVLALTATKASVVAPVTYSSYVPATSSVSQYSSSVYHGTPVYSAPSVYSASLYAPAVAQSVYPGLAPVTLTQAPNSPAVVLDGVNGVPLDTPEVVAARAAHYQAKALSSYGVHSLKKRSVAVAPVSYTAPLVSAYSSPVYSAYSTPVVSAYSSPVYQGYASPYVASPLVYSAVAPKSWSVHPY